MKYTVKDILRLEVQPALGCTEPTAIALGAAAATSLFPEKIIPDVIELWLDPNIFKNGLAVSIPGTGGLSGLDLASALGVIAGDPLLKMEVLKPVTDFHVKKASKLVAAGKVKVNLLSDHHGLYVKTEIKAEKNTALSVIENLHDNITVLVFNGNNVEKSPLLPDKESKINESASDLEKSLKHISLKEVISLVDDFDTDDLEFIEKGILMNMELARYGLKYRSGLKVGFTLKNLAEKKIIAEDVIYNARLLTSAAADARMSGARLPAMSSAGSGNHGLTAILPVKAVADSIKADKKNLCRAIGLSHIITACVKAHTGRLASICACSVAAGAGAAAGIAWLLGGTSNQIGGAIENIIEDLAGVICDGAKNSCALKLDTAAGTAVKAAFFSMNGLKVKVTDGIVGESPEKTIRNIGILSSQGMAETDKIILKIMLDKILSVSS